MSDAIKGVHQSLFAAEAETGNQVMINHNSTDFYEYLSSALKGIIRKLHPHCRPQLLKPPHYLIISEGVCPQRSWDESIADQAIHFM